MNRKPLGCLFEIAETLLLTIVIFLLIQNFVAQPYRVEMVSMERTLEENQYVLVDKLTPRFDDYSRGDIVVFLPSGALGRGNIPYIKRVIGEPGDHVEVRDGGVYVNGQRLDEHTYVFDGQPTDPTDEQASWDVPPDSLFVMGDHRTNSQDSRSFGPIPKSSVIGRAWLRYWPINTVTILDTPRYANVPSAAAAAHAAASPLASP